MHNTTHDTITPAQRELGLAAGDALEALFVGCSQAALDLPEYRALRDHLYKVMWLSIAVRPAHTEEGA